MAGFRCFIGIDQTGAQKGSGVKALPCAVLTQTSGQWRILSTALEKLDQNSLEKLWKDHCENSKVWIALDSVLGLPTSSWPERTRLWDLFSSAAQTKGYGQRVAEAFFSQFAGSADIPKRVVEIKAGANSVFRSRPFQKNIQTGTFRSWKELGFDQKWLNLWPHDFLQVNPKQPSLAEVYPTHSWRKLFGFKSRSPEQIPSLLKSLEIHCDTASQNHFTKDADAADACIAALTAYTICKKENPFSRLSKTLYQRYQLDKEGWILGVDFNL